MYTRKDAANPAYPTQWALNPSAYQNVDTSQVDWAALAQQWIAMREAAVIVGAQGKSDREEGEAPMEVENPDTSRDPQATEWNSPMNNWGTSWNQWGWGWSDGQMDLKMPPGSSGGTPMMDAYPGPENSMHGYTSGNQSQSTFQHGYWTAPPPEPVSNSRNISRSIDRRSKSKNRDKASRGRSHREKQVMFPPLVPIIDPIEMPPTLDHTMSIDAAKRRQLPAWIRDGLEKMEREKQRAEERERERKAKAEAEMLKKKLEEEELAKLKMSTGEPMIPAKSKFETDSEEEGSDKEEEVRRHSGDRDQRKTSVRSETKHESFPPTLVKKSKEEYMEDVMLAVRRTLTEILLEVTDQEIHTVSQEELARFNTAQASRLNAIKASKSKALAAIACGFGLGVYESSSESDDEPTDVTDNELQEIVRRKRLEFEKTAREIEADVKWGDSRETAEDTSSRATTPEGPRPRRSATPPHPDSDASTKKTENWSSKEVRVAAKAVDTVDGKRKLETILEEKLKKSKKRMRSQSPQSTDDVTNSKESSSSTSSSSDSESSSSSSSTSDSSSKSDTDSKVGRSESESRGPSSSSSESQKKLKKGKNVRASEKIYKSKHHDERDKKEKFKSKKGEVSSRRGSTKNRDYGRSHGDRYAEDSEDRLRKRKKSSRSISYESKSDRRRGTRDRSEDKARRREKKSYDRESFKRDRSYDRGDRDYDRYERSRDYERRRSRSGSYVRHRR